MAKMLSPADIAGLVKDTVEEHDDRRPNDRFEHLMAAITMALTEYHGGETSTVSWEGDCGTLVGVRIDGNVASDGGVYKNYDQDVTWSNGEEDQ